MYKNTTYYDLDLIMISQQGMVKQTKVVSIIFASLLAILSIPSMILKQFAIGMVLIVVAIMVLIIFVFCSGIFLKKTLTKNLEGRNITIEYIFGNNLTITSKVDGGVTTQSFEYNTIFQIVEQNECLIICPTKRDALVMKLDNKYEEYRNFIMEKLGERYIIQKKRKK